MNTAVTITLIVCITVIILGITQCVYQFILERDNYTNNKNKFELDVLKRRVQYLENKFKGADKE